ncbi:MAG: Thermosome subunit alpha [Candidatus Heimdallarchaeota archaeon LC_3]|nr:MAG: Thermosome subunit alpha [Candidatus Heimdallarchaeota archaeon LC_3]
MMTQGGTPVFILKEGTERTRGKDALTNNIAAARAIAESIRTALGPRGLDKMITDSFGDVTITNDGATILKEMDVAHPIAKYVVELSKTMDDSVGDGTTTVVVICGELLKLAEELIEEGIHPTILVEGFRLAQEEALKHLDKISTKVEPTDTATLKKLAKTSMGSKIVSASADYLADLVVKAIQSVTFDGKADLDDVKIEKKPGGSISETELIEGIVLDKEVVHPAMPTDVENAKILLLDEALEISKTEIDAELSIRSPDQIKGFLDREQGMLKEMADKVKELGATVVLCSKGIDDVVQHLMAKSNIMAVRRIKKSDMDKLAKATDAKIVSHLSDAGADDLGSAGHIYQRLVTDDKMVFVEECPQTYAVTLLIRGGTELVVDEAERSIHDALCVVRNVVEDGRIVPGGGAPEMAISAALEKFATTLPGREQLAVKAFGQALEVIPRTLAENTGLDPIDIMTELKQAKPTELLGVDPINKVVKNFKLSKDILEPTAVKRQAITSASEGAQMILRIDDVISGKGGGDGAPGGPGGPGGDMPDMDD